MFFVRSALVVGILAAAGCATHPTRTPEEKFAYRVEEYIELRHQAELAAGTTAAPASPAAIDTQLDRLTLEIQRLRSGFKRGVIFSGDVARSFRTKLASTLASPEGANVLRALSEVQPEGYAPRINALYPEGQPVASMPPTLLAALPALPPQVEYRVVGADLLLVDRNTRLVLDILPGALPTDR